MSPASRSPIRKARSPGCRASSVIETRVKSVSPVGRNVAMVRFETRRRDAGGQVGPPQRLGGDDPLPLFGRADADRGPLRQSAGLRGAALPPRRRGAAARRGAPRRPAARCRRAGRAGRRPPPGAASRRRGRAAPSPSFEALLALLAGARARRRSPRRCGRSRRRRRSARPDASNIGADQVVPLEVAPGYQLMLEFAPDERIESVAVGDSGAWQVTPNRSGDRVFVKPLQGAADQPDRGDQRAALHLRAQRPVRPVARHGLCRALHLSGRGARDRRARRRRRSRAATG